MANSKFEYVKKFEENDACLLNCWIVVRIDGRSFHKFSVEHDYEKPNDLRGVSLMNHCAQCVMKQFPEIWVAYGESDEYSFVLSRHTTLFKRRRSKIISNIVSLFASSFVFHWRDYFVGLLQYPPQFDARVILYPAVKNIRDYLSWRQADCHINNLYNTCFWALVQKGGKSPIEAENELKGTLSKDKHEILFSKFDINYNNIPPIFKKGTVIIREHVSRTIQEKSNDTIPKKRSILNESHDDIIGCNFWTKNPELLQ